VVKTYGFSDQGRAAVVAHWRFGEEPFRVSDGCAGLGEEID
jgi:hypothetical protein